ncbi:MAG: hypothetical protein RLZZ293_435 [Pseudomonadota bacterium]|jgi:hypothetical protein
MKNKLTIFPVKFFCKATVTLSLAMTFLISCSGSKSSSANVEAPQEADLSINDSTAVPILNNISTMGVVYIHNNGNANAKNVQFKSNLVLQDTEKCTNIAAHSSCVIKFIAPILTEKQQQGSSGLVVTYNNNNSTKQVTSIMRYQFINSQDPALAGVNINANDLKVIGKPGETKYITSYLYASGNSGTTYNNIHLQSNRKGLVDVIGGFSDGMSLTAGEVRPIEIAVNIQQDHEDIAKITPEYTLTSAQQFQQKTFLSGTTLFGSSLQLPIVVSSSSNLVLGQLPLLNIQNKESATVTLYNNGNADFSAPISVVASGSNASNVQIINNCSSTTLQALATNNCNVSFVISGESSGQATINFTSGGTTIASRSLYWYNPDSTPILYVNNSVESLDLIRGVTSQTIVFTLYNPSFGSSFTNLTANVYNTSGYATWTQVANSCGANLAPQGSCTISGTLTGVSDGYDAYGYTQVQVDAKNANTSYRFIGNRLYYRLIYSNGFMNLSPISQTAQTINASGLESTVSYFTVSNPSTANNMTINSFSIESAVVAIKPYLYIESSLSTCSAGYIVPTNNSCVFAVKLGSVPVSVLTNQTGTAQLKVNYSGGSPSKSNTLTGSLSYSVLGYGSYIQLAIESSGFESGANTSTSRLFSAPRSSENTLLTFRYTNPWNESLNSFYITPPTTQGGLVVSPQADACATSSGTARSLAPKSSCTYSLKVDRNYSWTSDVNDINQAVANATWIPQGGTSITANYSTMLNYIRYQQPKFVFAYTGNSTATGTIKMKITPTNSELSENLDLVMRVSAPVFSASPVSSNSSLCTVSSDTSGSESNTVTCNFKASTATSVEITYNTYNKGNIQTNGSSWYPCLFGCNYSMPITYTWQNNSYGYLSATSATLNLKSTAHNYSSFTTGTINKPNINAGILPMRARLRVAYSGSSYSVWFSTIYVVKASTGLALFTYTNKNGTVESYTTPDFYTTSSEPSSNGNYVFIAEKNNSGCMVPVYINYAASTKYVKTRSSCSFTGSGNSDVQWSENGFDGTVVWSVESSTSTAVLSSATSTSGSGTAYTYLSGFPYSSNSWQELIVTFMQTLDNRNRPYQIIGTQKALDVIKYSGGYSYGNVGMKYLVSVGDDFYNGYSWFLGLATTRVPYLFYGTSSSSASDVSAFYNTTLANGNALPSIGFDSPYAYIAALYTVNGSESLAVTKFNYTSLTIESAALGGIDSFVGLIYKNAAVGISPKIVVLNGVPYVAYISNSAAGKKSVNLSAWDGREWKTQSFFGYDAFQTNFSSSYYLNLNKNEYCSSNSVDCPPVIVASSGTTTGSTNKNIYVGAPLITDN